MWCMSYNLFLLLAGGKTWSKIVSFNELIGGSMEAEATNPVDVYCNKLLMYGNMFVQESNKLLLWGIVLIWLRAGWNS